MKSLPDLANPTSSVRPRPGVYAGQLVSRELHARPTGAGRAEFLVGNRLDPAATWSDRGESSSGGEI
jgi:hypothetical protein